MCNCLVSKCIDPHTTYTSAASFVFVSYITNPNDSMDLVERLLFGR